MAWTNFPAFSSSNIASIRYEEQQRILEVTFLNGGTYHYYDVPNGVVEDMKRAESKGVYLASTIKGHYRYSKV
ncbi:MULTISPECIES: KTSC domain-containing protein [Enterobacterales]|uniref:KTSC domain-containing protein n=2 Tax=Enterobacterales TaxID=91347 RepID=A0A0H5M000_YERIN|nr:KTSC domain-containing protein [Pectobacterium carotovorum]GKW08083.1 hypothetical protein PEC301889_25660 [Pectobacterium carotovorum subsp. carotovorum]CRY56769.1 Uncharacterised protein [Yersinia intermedia]